MSELYNRIDSLCKRENTNITTVCKELNIARSSLSELNAGRTKSLSVEYLQRIAKRFNVSMQYLIDGQEESENIKGPVLEAEALLVVFHFYSPFKIERLLICFARYNASGGAYSILYLKISRRLRYYGKLISELATL